MKQRTPVSTDQAPAAFGPFSQAIKGEMYVFVTGQLPLDPVSGKLVSQDVEEQTHRVIKNLRAILDEAGSSLDQGVKATVFITSMEDFDKMNRVYATYFSKPFPARSCIEVSGLAKGANVEIEAIALLP